jgi:hypothetical protein
MKYGIMLRSTTVDATILYYANVPKGFNRWITNKEAAHRFGSKKEAEALALNLFDQYGDKGIIVVAEFWPE